MWSYSQKLILKLFENVQKIHSTNRGTNPRPDDLYQDFKKTYEKKFHLVCSFGLIQFKQKQDTL